MNNMKPLADVILSSQEQPDIVQSVIRVWNESIVHDQIPPDYEGELGIIVVAAALAASEELCDNLLPGDSYDEFNRIIEMARNSLRTPISPSMKNIASILNNSNYDPGPDEEMTEQEGLRMRELNEEAERQDEEDNEP